MIRKEILRPGDILFFRTTNKSLPGAWFISWAQNVIGKSPIHNRSYSHVGIIDWDTDYILESRWPKSKRRKIPWKKWDKQYKLELWRIRKVSKQEQNRALKWAYEHLGEWYDLGLFFWGAFDIKHAEICSTFVAKAWKAGNKLFKVHKALQPDADFHTPDELIANVDIIKRIA